MFSVWYIKGQNIAKLSNPGWPREAIQVGEQIPTEPEGLSQQNQHTRSDCVDSPKVSWNIYGYGSKPFKTLVPGTLVIPKIAGKWMFIPA